MICRKCYLLNRILSARCQPFPINSKTRSRKALSANSSATRLIAFPPTIPNSATPLLTPPLSLQQPASALPSACPGPVALQCESEAMNPHWHIPKPPARWPEALSSACCGRGNAECWVSNCVAPQPRLDRRLRSSSRRQRPPRHAREGSQRADGNPLHRTRPRNRTTC